MMKFKCGLVNGNCLNRILSLLKSNKNNAEKARMLRAIYRIEVKWNESSRSCQGDEKK
jgi:hypothetical protein